MSEALISVFTKPWTEPLQQWPIKWRSSGSDGVELPVRPGYQVTPENAAAGLKDATRVLGASGLEDHQHRKHGGRGDDCRMRRPPAYRLSALWRPSTEGRLCPSIENYQSPVRRRRSRCWTGTVSRSASRTTTDFCRQRRRASPPDREVRAPPRLRRSGHGPLRGRWRADGDGSRYLKDRLHRTSQFQERLSRAGERAGG